MGIREQVEQFKSYKLEGQGTVDGHVGREGIGESLSMGILSGPA